MNVVGARGSWRVSAILCALAQKGIADFLSIAPPMGTDGDITAAGWPYPSSIAEESLATVGER